MNETDAGSVRAILESHQASGHHVDDRLWREVYRPGEMFLGEPATREEFLRLVWQSIPATRPLTPVGEPRTLFDCAIRLSTFGWDFQTLVHAGSEWFSPCVVIDTAFDYGKLGPVVLTPLNEKRNVRLLEATTTYTMGSTKASFWQRGFYVEKPDTSRSKYYC